MEDNGQLNRMWKHIVKTGVVDNAQNDYGCVSDKVKTNIPQLDEMLGGGLRQGFHAVTGGPGSYKSGTLLQVAYLAAMDGRQVVYVTNEISAKECWHRLAARKMCVDALVSGSGENTPRWPDIEECARMAYESGDVDALARIGDAIHDVQHACRLDDDYGEVKTYKEKNGKIYKWINKITYGSLEIVDMGNPIPPQMQLYHDEMKLLNNPRYLASAMEHDLLYPYLCLHTETYMSGCDVLVVDPVNALRTFEYEYDNGNDYFKDRVLEPRARMEQIVTTLDNYSRENDIATIGIFYGSRTRGSNQPPSMGDFKETSAIEYRARTAWELVCHEDMKWTGHPKPPLKSDEYEGEAVGLFLLKSSAGTRMRSKDGEPPIWLVADGAHNLIQPME